MRIAVRSRYTNIHGGYEEGSQYKGRPTFRRCGGGAAIFADSRSGVGAPAWHIAPAVPNSASSRTSIFVSSLSDGMSPDAASWGEEIERVWQPSPTREEERLWLDREFSHSRRSIGDIPPVPGGATPEWVPVRRLRAGTWKLFDGGISPNDLLQGAIGNCWLVAAMASLAEFPEAVQHIFRSGEELTADGRCEVQLFDAKSGFRSIVIDEYIPCHPREWWDEEGTPLFARPNGNEAWVLLLEKAFAKMVGSYMELSGGNCCMAFRAFTGERNVFVWARGEGEQARVEGQWKRMQLADGESHFVWTPGTEERRDDESLWFDIRAYDRQSFLVGCSMRAAHRQEYVRHDGLVESHAYSLLHAVEVEGHRLLFLRNPWGNDKRWNGRWSDGDEAWARYPSIRRRLRPEFREDGAFWIAWVDFQAIFDFVFVCPKSMRTGEAATEHARQSNDGDVPLAPMHRTNPRRRLAEALAEELPLLNPGTRVELRGLTSRLELNGRIVEIIKWDGNVGVYEVEDVPPPYWNCIECGEINKRLREICNVCSRSKETVAAEMGVRRYRVRPQCVILPAGTEVQIEGLVDFPELNGQDGVIVAFDRRAGRYHVSLPDGQVRAVRPPHVVARRPPQKESEFGRWVPPAEEPSHVDEPDPPDEIPCASEDDLRRLADDLDEEFRLKRDIHEAKLRRGQQLLREGEIRGRSLAELRGGAMRAPTRLRFTKHRPGVLRFGLAAAYMEAILGLDQALALFFHEREARQKLGPGRFSFHIISSPHWTPVIATPVSNIEERPKREQPKSGGWAGWICRQCGHINNPGEEFCEHCEAEES